MGDERKADAMERWLKRWRASLQARPGSSKSNQEAEGVRGRKAQAFVCMWQEVVT